ncbi:MAG: hypothetical protein ACRCWQ_02135 [Bacilli bacterium]
MKTRNGFVSNSSSSSFIIGVALLTKEQHDEVVDKFGNGTEFMSLVELCSANRHVWGGPRYDESRDQSYIEAFDGNQVQVDGIKAFMEDNPDGYLMYLDATGDEPDFDDDSWEYNYEDIDIDWFNTKDQEAAAYIHEANGEYTYGGGYNG